MSTIVPGGYQNGTPEFNDWLLYFIISFQAHIIFSSSSLPPPLCRVQRRNHRKEMLSKTAQNMRLSLKTQSYFRKEADRYFFLFATWKANYLSTVLDSLITKESINKQLRRDAWYQSRKKVLKKKKPFGQQFILYLIASKSRLASSWISLQIATKRMSDKPGENIKCQPEENIKNIAFPCRTGDLCVWFITHSFTIFFSALGYRIFKWCCSS